LISQLILVIVQGIIFESVISSYIASRVFSFQAGLALVAPGVLQLILEHGIFQGLWQYISRIFILAIYSTFHILNISAYWQWGLTNTAFYLPSGRGSGLEHYFMKDMYGIFYNTHWRPAFAIAWIGILVLILSGDALVFFILYFLPAAIWLWGPSFLNPGSLPTNVHEEQWKRLVNRDMEETNQIIDAHMKLPPYKPIGGNIITRSFGRLTRSIAYWGKRIIGIYTYVNFVVHMRAVRFIALLTIVYELVLAPFIPTRIFTDERRRILRWDEEDGRYRSIFFSSNADKAISASTSKNSSTSGNSSSDTIPQEITSRKPTEVKKVTSGGTIVHRVTSTDKQPRERAKFQ